MDLTDNMGDDGRSASSHPHDRGPHLGQPITLPVPKSQTFSGSLAAHRLT
jgi:hypothetical protein